VLGKASEYRSPVHTVERLLSGGSPTVFLWPGIPVEQSAAKQTYVDSPVLLIVSFRRTLETAAPAQSGRSKTAKQTFNVWVHSHPACADLTPIRTNTYEHRLPEDIVNALQLLKSSAGHHRHSFGVVRHCMQVHRRQLL
jgi:hypothetical protein